MIPFTKLNHKVSLLKIRAENDPEGPNGVEKQAIRTHVRGRPDENDHKKVERVPDPQIWTAGNEGRGSELFPTQMNLDWN
jgi:hypothetical protein